jgi:hypothetical protein
MGKLAGSKFETEVIDECSTVTEAAHLCREYRVAFGPGWIIYAVGVR